MIDVVIPYRRSPYTYDSELKYCLRSIEKYLTGVDRVYIIGECPDYLNHENVKYIPFIETDWYTRLTRNIAYKLALAANIDTISENFLYVNDDHFLLQSFNIDSFPNFHMGSQWAVGSGNYKTTIANTLRLYSEAWNFDIHAPMLINKAGYIKTVCGLDWKKPFGYCIKTCYAMANNITGPYIDDYKLNRRPRDSDYGDILSRPFFSIGDKAYCKEIICFLDNQYPHKSKYEK